MELEQAFGEALRRIRIAKGYTQEDFSTLSSRTYVSLLENGRKTPTITKVQQIASTMNVHPLTILLNSYLILDAPIAIDDLLELIRKELIEIEEEPIQKAQKINQKT